MSPLVAVSADQELHTELTARGVQLVQSVVGTVNGSAKETERFDDSRFSWACHPAKPMESCEIRQRELRGTTLR